MSNQIVEEILNLRRQQAHAIRVRDITPNLENRDYQQKIIDNLEARISALTAPQPPNEVI